MRHLSLLLALLLILPLALPVSAADDSAATVEAFVTLEGDGLAAAAIDAGGMAAYAATAEGSSALSAVTAQLDAAADAALALGGRLLGQGFYLCRSLGVQITADRLDELAAIDGVISVEVMTACYAPTVEDDAAAPTAPQSADPVYITDLLDLEAIHAAGTRGTGTVAAVIDTGFDVDHPVFAVPAGGMGEIAIDRAALETLLPLTHLGRTADPARHWVSEKLPFVYDYATADTDVASTNVHGTHVASILGGGADADGNIVGVAPGAQLLLMKVFSDGNSGTSSEYGVYCAVEDALLLGADVINLSLGMNSGHPYPTSTFSLYRHLEKARELGCAVICAAGNEGAAGPGSVYDRTNGIDLPLAANPDYGLISSPASYANSIAVGAYSPDRVVESGLGTVGDLIFSFTDSAENQGFPEMAFLTALAGQTLEYVIVPGLGAPEDYAGLDVRGRLALVERGEITFEEKLKYAHAAGAVGMICYDNVESDTIFGMAFEAMPAPAISVDRETGERLLAVPVAERAIVVDTERRRVSTPEDAGQPTDFTSRSTGLVMRPTVTAPGRIYAAVPGGGYVTAAGTSMATPATAGLIALAISAKGAHIPSTAALDAMTADLVTTADPLLDADGHPYTVRVQGGGSLNAARFLAAMAGETAQLRAADGRGLIELGDGLENGSFTLYVDLTNPTARPQSYRISASVGSDGLYLLETEGQTVAFADKTMRSFTDAAVTLDGVPCNRSAGHSQAALITLAAGETRRLAVEVRLSAGELEEYRRYFTNGFYLEGYLYAEQIGGEPLSLPYLGFSGDFDAVPYLDTFSYDGGASFYDRNCLIADARGTILNLGCSFYDENTSFRRDTIAFSPDGDGYLDDVQLAMNLLRNLHSFEAIVTDAAGTEVSRTRRLYYLDKSYLNEDDLLKTNRIELWNGADPDHSDYILPDGRYTLTLQVYDADGGVAQSVSLPLVLDTRPVELVEWSVRDGENGRRLLYVTLHDEHYPMRAVLYCSETDAYGREIELYRDAHNISYTEGRRSVTLAYDITGYTGDHIYLDLYDYALNFETHRLVLGN